MKHSTVLPESFKLRQGQQRHAFLLLLISSAIAVPLMAQSLPPQQVFSEGTKRLEKGELDNALENYQSLIRQGMGSAALYYNLGNLHYRKGERGRSVLWYERARRLAPRDNDIAFNLSLARSHIKDADESLLHRTLFYFTTKEVGTALTVFSWVFFILLGLVMFEKVRANLLLSAGLWTSGLLFGLCLFWFGAQISLDRRQEAIVVSPPGEVRNGPGMDYAVGFTIPEGSKVLVLNRRPEWIQVGVPQQGLKGWMPARELESISGWSS